MKGMTNALPVLIDASTLATKSDISDMETKTSANATFATKATVSQIQTAVGDCFNEVALGSDGKSLDFTAVDGQVNNVVLPSGGGRTWKSISLSDLMAKTDWKNGDSIMLYIKVGSFYANSKCDYVSTMQGDKSGNPQGTYILKANGFGGYTNAGDVGADCEHKDIIYIDLSTTQISISLRGDFTAYSYGSAYASFGTLKVFTLSEISSGTTEILSNF